MPAYKDTERNTWFVKFRKKDPVTGKNRQILRRGFATRREALDFERRTLMQDAVSETTFAQLTGMYFDYRGNREHVREHAEQRLRDYVSFNNAPVVKLTKKDLMAWYLQLAEEDLKPSTKNVLLGYVKGIFKYGADFYDLPNPARGLKRFKEPKRADFNVWTPEEFERFLNCVEGEHYKHYFVFLYWTGCRKAEAAGLQFADLDGRRIHIHRQMTVRGFAELKTAASDRWLILPDAVMSAIQPVLNAPHKQDDFLFGGETPLTCTPVYHRFANAIKASGVKPIRIHDFRHSFASNAIASGANIVAISRYLGHADINTTLRVYSHLMEHTEEDLIDRINKMSENGIKMVSNREKTA